MAIGDTPTPDPTVLTMEALARGLASERDYVDGQMGILVERLGGIDRATALLSETVNRVPTEAEKAVANLSAIVKERFDSIDKQFNERDTRSEREARDNKLAVDAAFAAQEKQAVAQNDANTTAINKSEAATTETINKLAELFESRTEGLREQVQDLKQRLQALESGRNGATEGRVEQRSARIAQTGIGAVVLQAIVGTVVVIGLIVGIVAAVHG